MNQKTSGKYAYYSEVVSLFKGKDICVIYHHLSRNSTHDEQIKQRAEELLKLTSDGYVIFAIRYKPYSPRAYFILTAQSKVELIRSCLHEFISGSCGHGWDSYYEI